MTVKVEREVEDFGFKYRENCCKCGTPTQYWYTANDVACCPPCAEVSEPEDMPTKRQWLEAQGCKLAPDWVPNVEKRKTA